VKRNTLYWIVGIGAAYYFLSTRTPLWTKQIAGNYLPASFIDQLTVMVTGAQPPPPDPSTAQTLVSAASQLLTAVNTSQGATN
jgi:hypothetical protein